MRSGVIIGAYALEPPALTAGAEERWYERVARVDGAIGLEAPFRGDFHGEGTGRFADLLPEHWSLVVTMLPLTMARMRRSPSYGLASDDPAGRRKALDDLARLLSATHELIDLRGDVLIASVQVPSAPTAVATQAALTESLQEISGWAWPPGCAIVVEHCDAAVGHAVPAKGFLSLESELSAVQAMKGVTRTPVGQGVNWGRSAIEGRSAATPGEHIERLAVAGTLRGLFLSGVADRDGPLGSAWTDAHNPVSTVDPTSILTVERIHEAVRLAMRGGAEYVGVKVQDPSRQDDLDSRMVALEQTVAQVQSARRQAISLEEGGLTGPA